ncbi:MAG TPA: hypothetical protein P5016_04985 [Verrucomicrobiales bacterium]|nr:hypothetical protein [Verrucomicrobiae bacterium]HRX53839.1 hypothetical protein [Verrucomicrobiales bacterium]
MKPTGVTAGLRRQTKTETAMNEIIHQLTSTKGNRLESPGTQFYRERAPKGLMENTVQLFL